MKSTTTAPHNIESVLDCLNGVRRSGKGWSAKCPSHEDRNASLSIAEGRDGRCLLFCFAGCNTEDIVGSIGLSLRDLFADTPQPARLRRRRPRTPVPYHVAQALADRPHFAEEWQLIKLLASLPEPLSRQDILGSWDYLVERYDLPFVARMAAVVREAAPWGPSA